MADSSRGNSNSFFQEILDFLKMVIRQIRSIRLNRNFLVFLVFLAISTFLWFIVTSMENMTATIEYRIKVVNVPKNVIYTSRMQDTIKVHVSALGSTYYYYLLSYVFRDNDIEIPVEYEDLDITSSQITVSNSLLKNNIQKFIGNEFKVMSVTPSQLSAYYTTGEAKKLPIVYDGEVTPGNLRVISDIRISPDSAEVYLPYSLYDSIKVIHADSKRLKGIMDTTSLRAAIKKIDNVKISPDSVNVKICTDLQTEKKLTVKIYCVNCPENKIVRTFPGQVDLTFSSVASRIKNITSTDFSIVVDYNQIKPGEKYCNVILSQKPDGVFHVHFTPQKVQYVMEQENE